MQEELTKDAVLREYVIGKQRLNKLIDDGDVATRDGPAVGQRDAPVLVRTADLDANGVKRPRGVDHPPDGRQCCAWC